MGSFFNRDVNCIRKFFRKRFRYEAKSWPTWKDAMAIDEEDEEEEEDVEEVESTGDQEVVAEGSQDARKRQQQGGRRLDLEVEASGFGRDMQRELESVSSESQIMGVPARR